MTDNELKELVASLAISHERLSKKMEETDRQMRETDRLLKESKAETDRQMKETDRQMRETDRQMKETDRQMKETDKRMENTDKKLEQMGIYLGNIGNNQGAVAEEYFVNSLKNRLNIGNLKFDVLLSGVELKTKKIRDEFDILLVNGDTLALIEVKYKVHPNIMDKLPKKIEHIKLMPSYKNYKIYAGIAGFKIPQEVIELAKDNGYFVLQRVGDIIEEISDNLIAS